jgi:hypothetical protein
MGHCGHIKTWKTAEKEIWPTQIVVCVNDLKMQRRLTPEQSRQDLIYTLLTDPDFDASSRDPEKIVTIAYNREDIWTIIHQSAKVVRWIRWEEDKQYITTLLEWYWVENAIDKWHFISVPDNFAFVSSTTNKIILQERCSDFDKIPALYRELFWNTLYKRLKAMHFPRKTRDITDTIRSSIRNNIEQYFTKIALL